MMLVALPDWKDSLMEKGFRRSMWSVFLAGILIGVGGFAANAAVAYGAWTSAGNHGGYSFQGRAWINNSPKGAGGSTRVTSGSAPAGWMGAAALSYRNDAYCGRTSVKYNSVSANVVSNSTTVTCGSGIYHSRGYSYRWNGSDYNLSGRTSPKQAW